MAHAARQNLRMQKELKLLLTDPPPGVSLSDDASSSSSDLSSSLSNIDALIKGPEGTVYANGVFKIKIQIPDRYPFQPPNVTFATPIYHPNIDNGGRICLDILNLPPKGAWQPSLNISTVLMSIGLLLSEPNPDDGLMCEASREYKYNRQTFDQKARSMTEKYARLGIATSTCSAGTPANPVPLMMETGTHGSAPRVVDNECNVDRENLSRVSRKLSLDASASLQKRNDDSKDRMTHTDNSSFMDSQSLSAHASTFLSMPQNGIDNEQPSHQDNTSKVGSRSMNLSPKKFSGNVKKLSLKSSVPPLKEANNEKENMQIQCSHTTSEVVSVASFDLFHPSSSHSDQQYRQDHEVDADSSSANQSPILLSGIGRKLASNSSRSPQKRKVDEHNVLHTHKSISLSRSQTPGSVISSKSHFMPLGDNCDRVQPNQVRNEKENKDIINMSSKKSGIRKKLSLEISSKSKWEDDGNKENVPPNYQSTLVNPSSSILVPQFDVRDDEPLHQAYNQGVENERLVVGNQKSYGTSKVLKQSLGLTRRREADQKVVKQPAEKFSPLHHQSLDEFPGKSMQLLHAGAHDEEKSGNKNNMQTEEEASVMDDAVIVLDSEDSDEDVKAPTRSRLSLSRKPLVGKRKVKS